MKYLDAAVQSIAESIRFDSSRKQGTPTAPFGQETYDCLCHFLSLAEGMGFETHNYDGYVGEIIFGEGEEFAILCHLDVVPAGSGWKHDPFGGIIEDGKIWGRGTVDDKGPAICALYAMKALKDAGFAPSKKIKLILGCNEEDGWACIDHYNEVAHMPETGISPDADFPVIFGEKGIMHVRLHFPITDAPFTSLEGGKAGNMVCDLCEATPRTRDEAKAKSLGLELDGEKLIARGKSAHGSTPEKGKNAILPTLQYFAESSETIRRILACVFEDVYGLKKFEDVTGHLTLSPNVIKYCENEIQVTCDIRYPATMPEDDVHVAIKQFGVDYEVIHHQTPLLVGKDDELVKTLLSVYEECTGAKAEPIAIGGGTYARALKHGVAFGPEMPGDEAVIHQPNEYITIERVGLLIDIYRKAIERLTK